MPDPEKRSSTRSTYLLFARGGGSLEDLWAFNEEIVARAVADSQIPVISAVGHEVDFTIADFVADLRAPTPSAAAEHAAPNRIEWLNRFKALENQLLQQLRSQLSQQVQRLSWLSKALQQQHPGQKLQRSAQRLDELEQRLTLVTQRTLQKSSHQLQLNSQKLMQHQPSTRIVSLHRQMEYLQQRLTRTMRQKLQSLNQRQAAIAQTLNAVSPLATLDRGYAIIKRHDNQQIVKSIEQIAIGDQLNIRLAQGLIVSDVKEISPT